MDREDSIAEGGAGGASPGEPGTPEAPEAAGEASGEARPQAARPRRLLVRAPITRDAHDRLSLFAVRAIFFFAAAALGAAGMRVLGEVTGREDLNPLTGILAGCGTAAVLITLESLFSRSPIRTISAIAFGLIMGLILSLVFQFVVEFIVVAVTPAEFQVNRGFSALLSFLQILTTTIFCYFGITILLQTRDDFKFIIPYVEFRKDVKAHAPIVLDTSCFVDGRILAILKTGVFDHRLVVPRFVLTELQTIADSADRSLRERGRRGMDILHEIERTYTLEIVDEPLKEGEAVDSALLSITRVLGGKVATTDYNLQKNGRVQGIPVLNINDLATALKPSFVPGETMTVRLLREGDDRGQAVGFLKDGTMVVVENGKSRIGDMVTVEVTSALQTNAGKMVFAKLRRQARTASGT